MRDILTIDDIDPDYKGKIYIQDYSKKTVIEGVKLIDLKNHAGEEGDFSEIVRVKDGELEQLPGFKIAQVNRASMIPHSVKAWHLHLKQDEIWYVLPSGHLLVGLWDLRKDSGTKEVTMRLVLGGGASQLLLIPKGVAHGAANFSNKPSELFYIVNQVFDINNPDEMRISWNTKGEDFWRPQKD